MECAQDPSHQQYAPRYKYRAMHRSHHQYLFYVVIVVISYRAKYLKFAQAFKNKVILTNIIIKSKYHNKHIVFYFEKLEHNKSSTYIWCTAYKITQ